MANEAQSTKKSESTGGATVTVASKLPMDFILQLHDKVKKFEPVMGGGTREYHIYQKRFGAPTYVINGVSYPQNKGPHQQLACGYAITHGIPKAFWEEWLDQQKDHEAVKNGMIFAHAEANSTLAEAREKENVRSGMERLDPHNLPKGLQTADRKAA